MSRQRALLLAAATAVAGIVGMETVRGCQLPPISDLTLNNTAAHGSSTNATINSAVSGILADVQQVRFDASNAYINATGIPSHSIGPWPTNPNMASQQNLLYRLPLSPAVQSGTKTSARILGPIGFMVNGVPFFDGTDGRSYNNQNIWHQNANVVEAPSFDAGKGHPQQSGMYHYHQQPALLRTQLGDDGTHHSPLLGFAYDGFPVYGPYGYASTNGTGAIDRLDSSYRLKNTTTRTNGPGVSTTFPLGYYVEDFEYVNGLGDLDVYNGRFAVTPEYPEGTYAYFTTVDATGAAAYPYIVGPQFNGVLQNDNRTQTVSVPVAVSTFAAASSATWSNTSGGEWCTNGNWAGGTAPKGLSAAATLSELAGAPAGGLTLHLDAPQRMGTITFVGAKPYTIAGTSPMVLLSFTSAAVNVTSGTHSITAPLVAGVATTFNVSASATLNVTNMQPTASAVTKSGAGTLNLSGLSCAALAVNAGTMALTSGQSAASKVTALSIAAGATLDVKNGKLIVKSGDAGSFAGGAYTGVSGMIQTGRGEGLWDGAGGMKTTMSDATTSVLTTLAIATAAEVGYAGEMFGGVSVAGSDVLVMYTWGGDATLDGKLDGDDYFRIDSHILQSGAVFGFHNGDFNYDGELNGDDYFIIDSNIVVAQQSTPFGLAAIPEPSGCALLAAAGAVVLRRRRRFSGKLFA